MKKVALFLLFATFCGCATGTSARHYTLIAVHPPTQETQEFREGGAVVAIGPITLPDYVDRPEIVTRSAEGEVNIASVDRWAGPLEDEVTRILIENVAAALRPRGMAAVSWRQQGPGQVSVPVTIVRLDAIPAKKVQINAQWNIRGIGPNRDTRFYQETFEAPLPDSDYRSIVYGMSQTIGKLSNRIAQTVSESVAG